MNADPSLNQTGWWGSGRNDEVHYCPCCWCVHYSDLWWIPSTFFTFHSVFLLPITSQYQKHRLKFHKKSRNVSKSCFKSFWVVKGEQQVLLVWIYLTLGIVVVGVPDHVIRKCSDRCLFIFISALLRFGLVIHCIHCVFPTQPCLGFRILL